MGTKKNRRREIFFFSFWICLSESHQMKERHNQLISKGGTKTNLLLLLLKQKTMECKDNPNISQSWHNQYISVEEVQEGGVCQLCCICIYLCIYIWEGSLFQTYAVGDTLLSVFGFCCCYTKWFRLSPGCCMYLCRNQSVVQIHQIRQVVLGHCTHRSQNRLSHPKFLSTQFRITE